MKELTKSKKNKNLFGVCAGIANYLGLNPTLVRVCFVIGAFLSGSIIFWLYLILALVLPQEE